MTSSDAALNYLSHGHCLVLLHTTRSSSRRDCNSLVPTRSWQEVVAAETGTLKPRRTSRVRLYLRGTSDRHARSRRCSAFTPCMRAGWTTCICQRVGLRLADSQGHLQKFAGCRRMQMLWSHCCNTRSEEASMQDNWQA